ALLRLREVADQLNVEGATVFAGPHRALGDVLRERLAVFGLGGEPVGAARLAHRRRQHFERLEARLQLLGAELLLTLSEGTGGEHGEREGGNHARSDSWPLEIVRGASEAPCRRRS